MPLVTLEVADTVPPATRLAYAELLTAEPPATP